jgi:hypothetical protein
MWQSIVFSSDEPHVVNMKLYADLHPTRQADLLSPAGMTPGDGQTDGRNNGCINLNPMGGGINYMLLLFVISFTLLVLYWLVYIFRVEKIFLNISRRYLFEYFLEYTGVNLIK